MEGKYKDAKEVMTETDTGSKIEGECGTEAMCMKAL